MIDFNSSKINKTNAGDNNDYNGYNKLMNNTAKMQVGSRLVTAEVDRPCCMWSQLKINEHDVHDKSNLSRAITSN